LGIYQTELEAQLVSFDKGLPRIKMV